MDGAVFELKLTARDGGIEPRSSYVYIYVYVNNSISLVTQDGGVGAGGGHLASGSGLHQNLTIVMAVVIVSGLITVSLITAIVLLRRNDRSGRMEDDVDAKIGAAAAHEQHKYNCRMEALKVRTIGGIRKCFI